MLDNNLIKKVTATAAGASIEFDTETELPANVQPLFIEGFASAAVTAGTATFTIETASESGGTYSKVYEGTITAGDLTVEEDLFSSADIDIKGFTFPQMVTERFIKITVTSADADPGQVEYEFRLQKVLIY